MPEFINARKARDTHHVNGTGITVAVLDTGCLASHNAFQTDRVLGGKDFTGGSNPHFDASGHGTSVAAVIASSNSNLAPGVAPGVNIQPVKVTTGVLPGNLAAVADGLEWVIQELANTPVHVICLSLSDEKNYQSFGQVASGSATDEQRIVAAIRDLRTRNIPTVAAAGNMYKCVHDDLGLTPNDPAPVGLGFPAIMTECISVGAAYHDHTGPGTYTALCNADATQTVWGQLMPFSQRLPRPDYTRLLAPGSQIKSASSTGKSDTAVRDGTSIAAPFVAGVIALIQQLYLQNMQSMPDCDAIEGYLMRGSEAVIDKKVNDNVAHTDSEFRMIDALLALDMMFTPPTV